MKKYKLLTLVISIFILLPKVYAECTQEEIDYFKEIEDEYQITYTFNEDTKDYTVTFYESEPDSYYYYFDAAEEERLCDEADGKYVCKNVKPGSYEIEVYAATDTCEVSIKKETLDLNYNQFSKDELCDGIEEFVLCQPDYDQDISYEEFISRVETYKKTKEPEPNNNNQQKSENKIIEYINNNLFQVIVISAFVVMVIITIILTASSIRKSRRLE